MLRLALFFLVVSLVAALFGFTGIAVAAAGIARIFFFIFTVVFLAIAGVLAISFLALLLLEEKPLADAHIPSRDEAKIQSD